MAGRTRQALIEEQVRFQTLYEIGCIPCAIMSWPGEPATIQHVTEGGVRLENPHRNTYPACAWHHLGTVPPECGGRVSDACQRFGPSFHHNKSLYASFYGTERQLIQIADGMVRIVQSAWNRGEYLPSREIMKVIKDLFAEVVESKQPYR